jgi:beta-lactamase class A
MIAVLKMADKDKSVLEKKFQYKEVLDKNYVPNIKDKNKIKLGSSYTVIELIEYMIEHSDNEAKELLVALIGEQYIVKVMKEIGVDILNDDLSKDFITVKEYSSFFRMLYNATYLSEKALEILSKSDYDSGIPSGVPKNILVANKFGERGFLESDQKQLHDCGIVYYNGNPYLLCVMTKGKDFNQLSNIIAGISQIAFQNINSFN